VRSVADAQDAAQAEKASKPRRRGGAKTARKAKADKQASKADVATREQQAGTDEEEKRADQQARLAAKWINWPR
jgi:hypothetical protein